MDVAAREHRTHHGFRVVGTAIAFAVITPEIKAKEQQAHLEKLVSERTQQKDHLISEINQRVRNQLQIMSSLLHLVMHRAQTGETKEALDRLSDELEQLHSRYAERSRCFVGHDLGLSPQLSVEIYTQYIWCTWPHPDTFTAS